MNCSICNEKSGIYPLCPACFKLRDEGKVYKDEKTGEWKLKNPATSENNTSVNTTNICIVCGKDAPLGAQCKECYYESRDYKDDLDKNMKPFELKDYYFNLKSNIYRMQNFDKIKSNCNKLFAMATLANDLHNDSSLINRINDDVKDLIEKKTPTTETKIISEYTEKQDERKESIIRATDGHEVKSQGEAEIDDILYNLRIVHCYGKKVSEIRNTERTIMCDWFIPVTSNSEGIYIEYWGMNTSEYNKNKEEKKKLYKEYNISLIQIEKDDIKDKQGLSDRLRMEISELRENILKKSRF